MRKLIKLLFVIFNILLFCACSSHYKVDYHEQNTKDLKFMRDHGISEEAGKSQFLPMPPKPQNTTTVDEGQQKMPPVLS